MNKRFKKVLLALLLSFTLVVAGKVLADSLVSANTDGKITVNKVATKDIGIEGNETYGRKSNVTLSVTGNGYTTSSSLDVVLVIDRSGSMNDKADKNDTQTKMQATKSSATILATNLLSNNTQGKTIVNMGIVTFGSDVIETNGANFNPTRLTSTSLTSSMSTIIGMINSIPNSVGGRGDNLDSQGTNIQSGLERAKTLLASSTANNKVVILLTDGKPTYFNYGGEFYGDGRNDGEGWRGTPYCVEEDQNGICTKELKPSTAAIEEADAIKDTDGVINGGATIYTVGFGLGTDTTTTEFLQNVATSDDQAFLANDEDELLANFNDIVKSITTIANNVVVEDIVPAGFVVDTDALENTYGEDVSLTYNDDGTTTITWNIGTLAVTEEPTLTYQVTALDDYYGSMYTNKEAILTGTATAGNPAYPNSNIEEIFPLPVVAIPAVTKNDTYTAKLGETLIVKQNAGILKNDSKTKLTDGIGNLVSDEIIIKSASCGNIDDITVNEDGSFSYTPDSSCYVDNTEVVFEYEVKSTVVINKQEYTVISNTSTITIDLTKDDSSIEEPIVTKTNNGGDSTTYIDGPFDYTINYGATIENHVGNSTITIVDTLPYELDLTKVNVEKDLDGGVYDASNKTITWIVELTDIDSYKNQNNNVSIEKNIVVYYKNVPTDVETIINTVNVSTNIDNKIVEDNEETKVVRSTLVVEYIDNNGNNLLSNVTSEGLVGSVYNTRADDVINVSGTEYKLVATRVNGEEVEKTNSYSGNYTKEETKVTYVYYKVTGDIDDEQTIFTKDGIDKVTASNSEFNYTITYKTKINNYIGDAKVTIVDKLPLAIDTNYTYDIDGGVYDASNKTITWVEEITGIDTYNNGEYEVSIVKNIKVVFKGLDATKRKLVNEASVKIETSKSSDVQEDEKVTELAINGDVIAHYVDINNTTLVPDVKSSGLVGNEYVTNAKEIAGYKLIEVKGNSIGNYIDGTIEVTYVYYKVEGTITNDTVSKNGTTEVNKTDATFEYTITYEAIIKDYIGDAIITIVDTLPLEIDTNYDYDLDGGAYDATTKTITWTEEISGIDTNKNGNYPVEIVKNIKITYKDLAPTVRKVTNEVVGTIKTEVTEETTEPSKHDTAVKVNGNVIAHYVDTESNTLASDVKSSGLVGDAYTTSAKTITGYKLVEIKGNDTGNYIDGTIEVTYIYYKIEGNIGDNIITKTGTEEVNSVDATFEYTITYNTLIKDYIGNAKVTIVDTLPLEIDTNYDYDLDGGVYDSTTKTITWVEEITDIDTNKDGNYPVEIVKNIKITYKDLDPTIRKVTNKVVGTIKTEVKEDTTEPEYKETLVNVRGNVIVHYVDTDNNVLVNNVELNGLVGDEYVTSAMEIAGYELVRIEGNDTGKYIDGTIEVTYVYYKETGEVVGDSIIKTGTNEVNNVNSTFEYSITYEAVIKNYIGNAKVTIVDTLPLEIDTNYDYDLDGGMYDATTKTITWVEEITGIDTNKDGNYLVKILKNIKVNYKDLDPMTREVTNEVVGTIKTEVTEKTTEPSKHNTAVKVSGKVITHYVDTNNNILANDVEMSDLVGNDYITSAMEFDDYQLVNVKGNETGKYIDGTIEVTYIYYKETGDITNNEVLKLGSKEIVSSEDKVNYTINYKTKIDNYIGNAVITIVDYLPYKLDLSLSDLAGGIYDEENATITWVINVTDIDTYNNGIYTVDIIKELVLSYKDIDLTQEVITNNVIVTIKTDVSEDTTDDSFETEVNVNGKVLVEYVDEEGNVLSESIILSGKVGSTYETIAKDIEGYVLITVEGNINGNYLEETQIVTYIYRELGKGGDVEVLPPQTGVTANNTLINVVASLILGLIIAIRRII